VKGDIGFFKRFLEDFPQYNTKEFVLVDDSPSKIESAAKNGISGILFKNNVQVLRALAAIK
jgi:FMN phosphatase YigB (HAD superfamily)